MLNVFILVESTLRELDHKINLARLFCHKNCRVIFGNPAFIRDELKYKNYEGIFLENGCMTQPEYYKALNKKNIFVYDLAEEGSRAEVYTPEYPLSVKAMEQMRKIYLWGGQQKAELIEKIDSTDLKNKYEVIGYPGFDLSTKKYKQYNLKLKPKGLPKSYILINCNFGYYNSHSIEEKLQAFREQAPENIIKIKESYVKEEKEWKIFHSRVVEIIKNFPDETFIIRPHPCEISEKYKKYFEKFKNVIVTKQGSVNYTLSSAKMVLHKDCTTAFQAYIMGIPAISILQYNAKHFSLTFSECSENVERTISLIKYILEHGGFDKDTYEKIKNRADILEKKCFENVGNSSELLVDDIINDYKKICKRTSQNYKLDSRSPFQKIKFFLRKFLPLHYKLPVSLCETLKEFSQNDIAKRLNLLDQQEGIKNEYKIKKLFPNAFQIEIQSS